VELVEPMGDSAASENKPLTNIDLDFSIKNGAIFGPKCNQKCNQPSETIARDRRGLHSVGVSQTRKPKPLVTTQNLDRKTAELFDLHGRFSETK
jgi:hypothetical protein